VTPTTTEERAVNSADAAATYGLLRAAHPDAHCELDHQSPFQLIVATVLSAQSTDVAVNKVTPALFERWPTAAALASAKLEEVERAIGSLGMFRQKAKHIVGLSEQLVARHGGEVPADLSALVALPGVGRKTANVVLGVAFERAEGVVVDTHVGRLAQRLGWTEQSKAELVEQDLMALFGRKDWVLLSHTLIFHGRRICTARAPQCTGCPVRSSCPSAHHAAQVGRKHSTRAAAAKTVSGKTATKKTATNAKSEGSAGMGTTVRRKKTTAGAGGVRAVSSKAKA
jgi:endonuclease III